MAGTFCVVADEGAGAAGTAGVWAVAGAGVEGVALLDDAAAGFGYDSGQRGSWLWHTADGRTNLGDHANNEAFLLNAVRLDGVCILKDFACAMESAAVTGGCRAGEANSPE